MLEVVSIGLTLLIAGVATLAALVIAPSSATGLLPVASWVLIAAGVLVTSFGTLLSPIGVALSQAFWRWWPAPADQHWELQWEWSAPEPMGLLRVTFWTRGQAHRLVALDPALGRPVSVHFRRPVRMTIRRDQLPAEVPMRRDVVRITRFVLGGFVIEEAEAAGDEVVVELYFD